MTNICEIDINKIFSMIPHRYPILLVDRIKDYKVNDWMIGIKNVTVNEPHFNGHFPAKPIMPGVLIIESMAQTAGILVMKSQETQVKAEDKLVYFMSIENAKFRKLVTPGDIIELHVKVEKNRANVWKFSGKAMVNNEIAAEATFSAMLVDK